MTDVAATMPPAAAPAHSANTIEVQAFNIVAFSSSVGMEQWKAVVDLAEQEDAATATTKSLATANLKAACAHLRIDVAALRTDARFVAAVQQRAMDRAWAARMASADYAIAQANIFALQGATAQLRDSAQQLYRHVCDFAAGVAVNVAALDVEFNAVLKAACMSGALPYEEATENGNTIGSIKQTFGPLLAPIMLASQPRLLRLFRLPPEAVNEDEAAPRVRAQRMVSDELMRRIVMLYNPADPKNPPQKDTLIIGTTPEAIAARAARQAAKKQRGGGGRGGGGRGSGDKGVKGVIDAYPVRHDAAMTLQHYRAFARGTVAPALADHVVGKRKIPITVTPAEAVSSSLDPNYVIERFAKRAKTGETDESVKARVSFEALSEAQLASFRDEMVSDPDMSRTLLLLHRLAGSPAHCGWCTKNGRAAGSEPGRRLVTHTQCGHVEMCVSSPHTSDRQLRLCSRCADAEDKAAKAALPVGQQTLSAMIAAAAPK